MPSLLLVADAHAHMSSTRCLGGPLQRHVVLLVSVVRLGFHKGGLVKGRGYWRHRGFWGRGVGPGHGLSGIACTCFGFCPSRLRVRKGATTVRRCQQYCVACASGGGGDVELSRGLQPAAGEPVCCHVQCGQNGNHELKQEVCCKVCMGRVLLWVAAAVVGRPRGTLWGLMSPYFVVYFIYAVHAQYEPDVAAAGPAGTCKDVADAVSRFWQPGAADKRWLWFEFDPQRGHSARAVCACVCRCQR